MVNEFSHLILPPSHTNNSSDANKKTTLSSKDKFSGHSYLTKLKLKRGTQVNLTRQHNFCG